MIAVNKWDLVDDPNTRLAEMRERAARLLPQMRGAPVVPVSSITGSGIRQLMSAIVSVHETWNRRISTARLNRWLAEVLERSPPPAVAGRRIKIRYVTQPKARPPHFTIFGNQLSALPASYERYLINNLRDTFNLPGVPIRISKHGSANPFDKGKRRIQ